MSNIYIQEPPTEGKVLLETTVGDIEIELWPRECPKACRNFVQLCMERYYDKTKFHRVVKDFIVQGGDPTGTGAGGESIYGHPFKDEIHSRLRFVRRGLVAMANAGKDDNGSQFFFTLGPAQELQNKHTIFGKVVGDTVYNMLRLQEGLIGDDERPENPNKILRTKVLNNPFKDIEPRQSIELIRDEDRHKKKKPQSKMKATKDFSLLSFGDEAEEDEEDLVMASKDFESSKGKSSHDLLKDPKLLSRVGDELVESSTLDSEVKNEEEEGTDAAVLNANMVKSKLKRAKSEKEKIREDSKRSKFTKAETEISDEEDEEIKEKKKKREEIKREIKELTRQMKAKKEETNVKKEDSTTTDQVKELTEEEKSNDMLRTFHENQSKYSSKTKPPKKGSSAREEMTMKLLNKFKNKLHSMKESQPTHPSTEGADDNEDVDGDGWMANELNFENNDPVLAKDASSKDADWFDIYDPRNPVNKRRRHEKTRKKTDRK